MENNNKTNNSKLNNNKHIKPKKTKKESLIESSKDTSNIKNKKEKVKKNTKSSGTKDKKIKEKSKNNTNKQKNTTSKKKIETKNKLQKKNMNIKNKLSKLKNNKSKINNIIIIILIIIIIVLLILLRQKNLEKQNTIEELNNSKIEYTTNDIKSVEDQIKELKEKHNNNDILGILSIKGGDLNVAVVKSNDNKYYLTHSISKSKSIIGSVFMDYRQELNSKQINIYGHNSTKYNPPFKILENYLNKEYYDLHKYLEFKVNNEKRVYEIFGVIIAEKNSSEEHMNIKYPNDNEYLEHFIRLKDSSLYDTSVDINKSDEILVLQTCVYGSYKGKLLVIVAKLIS